MDGEVLSLQQETDWKPEAGGLTAKLENIRELLTPGNVTRQELTRKFPYLDWNQSPPKSQQVPVQDITC